MAHYVYLLRCADDSLYVGESSNLRHASGVTTRDAEEGTRLSAVRSGSFTPRSTARGRTPSGASDRLSAGVSRRKSCWYAVTAQRYRVPAGGHAAPPHLPGQTG